MLERGLHVHRPDEVPVVPAAGAACAVVLQLGCGAEACSRAGADDLSLGKGCGMVAPAHLLAVRLGEDVASRLLAPPCRQLRRGAAPHFVNFGAVDPRGRLSATPDPAARDEVEDAGVLGRLGWRRRRRRRRGWGLRRRGRLRWWRRRWRRRWRRWCSGGRSSQRRRCREGVARPDEIGVMAAAGA